MKSSCILVPPLSHIWELYKQLIFSNCYPEHFSNLLLLFYSAMQISGASEFL